MTHPSGLQYSYDDLDLVCCHGVDSEGPWMESGASKQSRRTRCASMPEGCHQLPAKEEGQTFEPRTCVVNDVTEQRIENNLKVLDLQESVHNACECVDVDIFQGACETKHLQTSIMRNSGEFHSGSNSGMSRENISLATDSCSHGEKTGDAEGKVTAGSLSPDIGTDDCVFKSPHISCEEQQYISISSNNGSLLSESAGEQSGKLPNHQETKQSHAEGDCRPPEVSETALNRLSAAELEPQTDLPDVKEEEISIFGLADTSVALPDDLLNSSVSMMESGGVMSPANSTVQPVVASVLEEVPDIINDSQSVGSSKKLDALNDPKTLNENPGLERASRDIQERDLDHHGSTEVLDTAKDLTISCQKSMKQHQVETKETVRHQGEESVQAESSEEAAEVRTGPITPPDVFVKGQCCPLKAENNFSSSESDNRYLEIKPDQAESYYPEKYEQTTASLSESTASTDDISVSKELACCEDQVVAQQLENSISKLDTILEVSQVEPDDTPAFGSPKNSDFTQSPDAELQEISVKPAPKNPPLNSAEVKAVLSPEGCHGNQKASGCCFGESPASEVADGQTVHRHRPGQAESRMEETNEEAQDIVFSNTKLSNLVLNGTNEPGEQRDNSAVKVRMRKVRLL